MADKKTMIRFYTIADFCEEEVWLRNEHQNGWRFTGMVPPCIYHFERCEPEDVIYRLDFKNNTETESYMQMCADYGWDYCGKCFGWLYFRKSAKEAVNDGDSELFSDNASLCEMIDHIIKRRMLPISIVFLCCVIPNCIRFVDGSGGLFFTIFWSVMLALYIYLIVHCGRKLKRMQREIR